jgi:hypothetical protein
LATILAVDVAGICLSAAAHGQVRERLDLTSNDRRAQRYLRSSASAPHKPSLAHSESATRFTVAGHAPKMARAAAGAIIRAE